MDKEGNNGHKKRISLVEIMRFGMYSLNNSKFHRLPTPFIGILNFTQPPAKQAF